MAALPGLREQLKRFEETELAARLEEQASVQHEKRILDDFSSEIEAFGHEGDALKPEEDTAVNVLPPAEDASLPHRENLTAIQAIAQDLHDAKVQAAVVLVDAAACTLASCRSCAMARCKQLWYW